MEKDRFSFTYTESLFPNSPIKQINPNKKSTNEILITDVRRELKKETVLTFLFSAIRLSLINVK